MADIFLSYASEDRERARSLAAALEGAGWSVWWDRTIPTGRKFDEVIDQALHGARSIVVLWSRISVHKDWVLEEAEEGREKGVLVPVFIENVKPPRGFRRYQAADLSDWDPQTPSPAFKQLVTDIAAILGAPSAQENAQAEVEEIAEEQEKAKAEAERAAEAAREADEARRRQAQQEAQRRAAEEERRRAAEAEAARRASEAEAARRAREAAERGAARSHDAGLAASGWVRWRRLAWLALAFSGTAAGLAWGLGILRSESLGLLQYAFPGLFGLLLGYVVLGDWARALFVAAVAGPVFFNVAVPLGSKYYFIPAGVAGALLMTVALVLWRRQLFGIGLLLRAALIGAVGGYLFGLLGGGIWSYMAWQVMVGCVVADYGLQSGAGVKSWSLAFKPVIAIGAASLLIGVAGISANAMRETQASDTYPGTTETNPLDGLAYHWIPKGEFQMGCSPDDNQCYGDESPSHRITITNGFWLGGTEVTTAAYRKVVASMPPAAIFLERDLNPSWSDDQLPITNVTWVEAGSYCASVDGRLPTEAEWEYAARAGTTGASYGRLDEIAWYANNSGDQRVDGEAVWLASGEDNNEFSRRLAANGNRIRAASQLYVNAWGLVDMLGNAAEWVQDDYGDQLYGTRSGATTADPSHSTGTSSSEKIRRGGSWYNRSRSLRASFRANTAADDRSVIAGFRCVWDKAATDARNASGE